MKRSFITVLIAIALSVVFLAGCSSGASNKEGLSDLGGVYASTEGDLDLRIEVSGRLSEGVSSSAQYQDITGIAEREGGPLSNKLLRWGISRRSENQIPAADPGAPELLSKYGGAYIGDINKSVIYLTFDEGYENGYTPLILDTLRDNGVKAVFFITGPYLKVHQDLVRRMVEEGHIVGNHTIHHPSMPELGDNELEEEILGLDRAFHEKFGQHMKFLRPPKGEYSERTLAFAQKLGYSSLFWSFAYDDWYRDKVRGPGYANDIVMRNLHNGAVLLLHAVSQDNAKALDMIIKGSLEKGYTFGDPDELLPVDKGGSD